MIEGETLESLTKEQVMCLSFARGGRVLFESPKWRAVADGLVQRGILGQVGRYYVLTEQGRDIVERVG